MKRVDLVRTLVITFGYVLMFLAIDYKVQVPSKYSWVLLVAGAGILVFEKYLFKGNNVNFGLGLPAVVRTLAYILLFLGLKTYLNTYVQTQWIWFIVVGFLIYNYHDKIVSWIVPREKQDLKSLKGGFL